MNSRGGKGKEVWDRSIFSCEEAYNAYTKGILKNKLIPESGLENRELDPLYESKNKRMKSEGQSRLLCFLWHHAVYKTPWNGSDEYSTLKDQITPKKGYQGQYMSEMLQRITQKQGMTPDEILPYNPGGEGMSVGDAQLEEDEGSEEVWSEED
ncbi:hypothetical protein H6P81_017945 [Aristolochia fimbriata]|uniref:Uncharacterized protein n=1 Tax=Aristolochia fimbriata TaxID=158543 RepID=A0AAV7E2I6_ARIFI|nr:hypothetical protein H6P81_017945 [Aristolochia fimbriata]